MIVGNVSRLWAVLVVSLSVALAGCDTPEERIAKHYERGMALLEEGQPEKARLEFQNIAKIDENHAPSRYELGRLYERDQEYRAALSNYRLVAELDAAHVGARKKIAQIALLANDLNLADTRSAEALELAPEDAEALAIRAAVLQRQGQNEDAVALARRAIAIEPGQEAAHAMLTSERVEAQDLDAALAQIDAGLAANPDSLSLNLLRLRVLELRQDADAIGAQLRKLIALQPEQVALRQALARWHVSRQELDMAEDILRAIADDQPNDAQPRLDLVRLIAQHRGDEAARDELQQAAEAGASPEMRATLTMALIDFDLQTGNDEGARAALRAMIDSDAPAQKRAEAHVRLAQIAIGDGDEAAARETIDAALELDGQNVPALSMRAAALLQEDRTADAIADLRRAADLDPDNIQVMLLLSRAFELSGNIDLAAERLGAATRASGYRPEITLAYVNMLRKNDRAGAAAAALERSLEETPDNVALLMAKADLALATEDLDTAEQVAQRLEAQEGGDAAARRILIALRARQGRQEEAIALLRDIAETDPNADASAFMLSLRQMIEAGDIAGAEALIAERAADDPNSLLAAGARADLQLFQNDAAGARDTLRAYSTANPDSAQAHAAMARLELREQNIEAAEKVLREGIDKTENDANLRLLLAQLLERRGAFGEAIDLYIDLYDNGLTNDVIANNLASLISDHRDSPEDLDRAARIAQRFRMSDVPEFQDTYGWTQHLIGQSEAGLRALSMAVENRPDNPWIRYHAGTVFATLGNDEKAREHLSRVLEIDPAFPHADAIRERLAATP